MDSPYNAAFDSQGGRMALEAILYKIGFRTGSAKREVPASAGTMAYSRTRNDVRASIAGNPIS
jgi:hypothetical protein